MIKLTDNIQNTLFAVEIEPILGARIHTLFSCYGNDYPFLRVWSAYNKDKITAVLSIVGKSCTLVIGDDCDFSELCDFLCIMSDIESIETNSAYSTQINSYLQYNTKTRPLMKYNRESFPQTVSLRVEKGVPKEFFPILMVSDTDFAKDADYPSWLYDTHRRVSKGFGQIYILKSEEYVAVGGSFCGTEKSGVLGSIATLPNHRGKGYGSEIVQHITACLVLDGKTPYLIAAQTSLVDFYTPLGYIMYGESVIFTPKEK